MLKKPFNHSNVRNAETEERKKSTEEALNRWFYLITFANSDRLEKKQ